MSHVKLVDGKVVNYNYKLTDLLTENPNTSFPKGWQSDEQLLVGYGIYPIFIEDTPAVNADTHYTVTHTNPSLVDGKWVIGHDIIAYTDAELSDIQIEKLNKKEEFLRNERNKLLKATDWTQVADAPVDQAAWATYRQALRDITAQEGFPQDITWPTKPE